MSSWEKPCILSQNSPLKSWIILFNVVIPTMLAVYSGAATIVMESNIIGGLAIDGAFSSWITICYLLGINTTVPIANRVADRIGYKKLYFIGIALYLAGSTIAVFAGGFYSIALARLIEGIGAGFIFPVGLATITQCFSKERLPLALILYIGLGFGAGLVMGCIIPGYFAMHYIWQYGFIVLIPPSLISLVICYFFHDETERIHRGKFDFFGFFFFASFICSFIIALSEGNLKSTDQGWRSSYIIFCFIYGLISLILVYFIEKRADNPIIPLPAFKKPVFTLGCVALFTLGMALFSSLTLMANYMEYGLSYDKITIGINLMSYGIAIGLFSMLAAILMKLKIPAMALGISGLILVIFSLFLSNQLTIFSGKELIFIILFIKGAGVGLSFGPITSYALSSLEEKHTTDGATLLTFFRQVGATYGGSILGIIVIRRRIFHDLFFSQSVNPELPGYHYNFLELKNHIMRHAGSSALEASYQAKAVIIENIKRQSYVQSLNDALMVFGYVLSIITIALIVVSLYNYLQKPKKFLNHG